MPNKHFKKPWNWLKSGTGNWFNSVVTKQTSPMSSFERNERRMHSSKMRTTRLLTVSHSIPCILGVPLQTPGCRTPWSRDLWCMLGIHPCESIASAAKPAAKSSADVAPEVTLKNLLHAGDKACRGQIHSGFYTQGSHFITHIALLIFRCCLLNYRVPGAPDSNHVTQLRWRHLLVRSAVHVTGRRVTSCFLTSNKSMSVKFPFMTFFRTINSTIILQKCDHS